MTSLTIPSKYHRNIRGVNIDTYDIARAYDVTDSAHAHALKKVLMPGGRGGKGKVHDLEEAIWSLQNYVAFLKGEAAPDAGGTTCEHKSIEIRDGRRYCTVCGEVG